MLAADVLRLVSGALQDLEPGLESRWPWEADEDRVGLLDFLNAALRAVALQRPDCCAVTEVIRLEPGMLQHIPSRRRHGASRDATGFWGRPPLPPTRFILEDVTLRECRRFSSGNRPPAAQNATGNTA